MERRPWAVTGALLLVVLAGGAVYRLSSPKEERGAALFAQRFTVASGLGPRFNARSCVACHRFPSTGGVGRHGLATVTRSGRCGVAAVRSVRNAPALYGDGLIDAIPAAAIVAGARPRGDGVHGRVNRGPGGVGRFGWKGDVATLGQFVAQALRNELGVTSAPAPGCHGEVELDATAVRALTRFVASLPAPPTTSSGSVLFTATGCGRCHVARLAGVPLHSDLLLHDMGILLDDGVRQGAARGRDWRTAPLWGLSLRSRYLHDGRATSLRAAILAHGGEARRARNRFQQLRPTQQRALVAYLAGL